MTLKLEWLLRHVHCLMRGTWGALNTTTAQKEIDKHRITQSHKKHSTASNYISPNTADWKTQTSHTVRFEITATPQIEILFTTSPYQKNINTANPHVPLLDWIMNYMEFCCLTQFMFSAGGFIILRARKAKCFASFFLEQILIFDLSFNMPELCLPWSSFRESKLLESLVFRSTFLLFFSLDFFSWWAGLSTPK